jgi:hypothetical protein
MMKQLDLQSLVREILGEDYRHYEVSKYTLTEDIAVGRANILCHMTCQISHDGSDETYAIEGTGVGMVDALFKGLKTSLSDRYPSLEHIEFVEFGVTGDFTSNSDDNSHSDAQGRVRLAVQNTEGRQFNFRSTSMSVSASSVSVVVKAVEHFVNAELAVLRIYDWIEDAQGRNRPDLAEKYTHRLADLVQNATYSASIERRKPNQR